jgi:hypothetical protein
MAAPWQRYGLTETASRRLDTYLVEIVAALRPEAPSVATTDDIRFGRQGSLQIRPDASWVDYEDEKGDRGAITLIAHLLDADQHDLNPASVTRFAQRWLADHPGNGSFKPAAFDASKVTRKAEQYAAFAVQVLRDRQVVSNSEAELNLNSRGLFAPWPNCVAYYPRARSGEGALVGILSMPDGRVVDVQLGYLDPQGRKSTLEPKRRRFSSELNPDKRRGAAFRIPAAPVPEALHTRLGPGDTNESDDEVHRLARNARKLAGTTLIGEGLEDALSLHRAFPYSAIIGLPGVWALRHQQVKANQPVIVVKDGDASDVTAVRSLNRGVDELLLQRAELRVTATPEKQNGAAKIDANLILQRDGLEALQGLVLTAEPAKLSLRGAIRRLASLSKDDRELQRHDVADHYKVRLSYLDHEVAALREAAKPDAEDDPLAEEPHPAPVPAVAVPLDAALAVLKRTVIADEITLATGCVWALHTHFVHHVIIRLAVTPRLLISAPGENCGKTTFLEGVLWLASRGRPLGNPTAANLFRMMDALHPTLCIDEADKLFRHGRNVTLLEVINLGYRRTFSKIPRIEENSEGKREQVLFDSWGAIAMAMVGLLSEATTQSRCTTVFLRRALPSEAIEHIEAGDEDQHFGTIRRQFARFAVDLSALPPIQLPTELTNRTGDNWKPLLQLATLAGPRWLRMITAAAMRDADQQSTVGSLVPLLTDIRRVFGAKQRITTQALISGLIHLEEPSAEWDRTNRGGPITDVWLLRRLKGVIQYKDATGAEIPRHWREGGSTYRGFELAHFADAFARYLPEGATEDSIIDRPVPVTTPEGVSGAESAVPGAGASVPGCAGSENSTRHKNSGSMTLPLLDKFVAVPGVPGQTAYRPRNAEHAPGGGADEPDGGVRDVRGRYVISPGTPGTATNLSNNSNVIDPEFLCRVEKSDPAQPGTDPAQPGTDPAQPGTDPAQSSETKKHAEVADRRAPEVRLNGQEGFVAAASGAPSRPNGADTSEPIPDIDERW